MSVADIYVKATGSDTTGTGSLAAPYATLAKAWASLSGAQRVIGVIGDIGSAGTDCVLDGKAGTATNRYVICGAFSGGSLIGDAVGSTRPTWMPQVLGKIRIGAATNTSYLTLRELELDLAVSPVGPGLLPLDCDHVEIDSCVITNHNQAVGGGSNSIAVNAGFSGTPSNLWIHHSWLIDIGDMSNDTVQVEPSGWFSHAIYLESVSNPLVEHCVIKHISGRGLQLFGGSGVSGGVFQYNLFDDCGMAVIVDSDARNNTWTQNLFAHTRNHEVIQQGSSYTGSGNTRDQNAYYSNPHGNGTFLPDAHTVTVAANPFTDYAGGDLSLKAGSAAAGYGPDFIQPAATASSTIPPTTDRNKPSVAPATSLHYFGGGIAAGGSVHPGNTALQNAIALAKQVRMIIGQFNKFNGDEAKMIDPAAGGNATLWMGQYHKSAESDRPLTYGLPEPYYAHDASGAKINVFAKRIYLMQPDGAHAFNDPRGFSSPDYRTWNALDNWYDTDAQNAQSPGAPRAPFQVGYLDSLGIAHKTAVIPGTRTQYGDSVWHDLVFTLGDAMQSTAARSWGTGIVFANGLSDGGGYFGAKSHMIAHVQGAVMESCFRGNGSPATAWKSESGWADDVNAMIDIQSKGKWAWAVCNINNSTAGGGGFTGSPFTAAQVDQWREFTAGSYLLGNNGKCFYEFVEKTSIKPYDEIGAHPTVYGVSLGLPLDFPKAATPANAKVGDFKKNGVYQRRFEKGIVLVNPTGNDVTLNALDRAYKTIAGANISTPYVVKAHTSVRLTTTQVIIAGVPTVGTPPPQLTGTPNVGQTLHVSVGTWTGDQPMTPTYQWLRDGAPIGGATAADYTLVTADNGHNVSATVTMTNAVGFGSFTTPTVAIGGSGPTGPQWTTPPSLSGDPFVSGTLTADPGVITDTPPRTISYQWEQWSADQSVHHPVTGATSASYDPVDTDVGWTLVCKVTDTDTIGSAFARTPPSAVIEPEPLPQNTRLPAVIGTPQVASTLIADPGQWDKPGYSFSYQWVRHLADGTSQQITGAASRTYTLTDTDTDATITVLVTAQTPGGSTTTVESAPSAPIAPLGGGGSSRDDTIGKRQNQPLLVEWKLVLYSRAGQPLGPLIGTRSRKLTINLNGHDQLEFQLLLSNPQVANIIPYASVVKLWRIIPGLPVDPGRPDFGGIVAPSGKQGEANTASYTCFSPDWVLEDRFVWEHLLNGLPFKQKVRNVDQAQILFNLLDYTNARGDTLIVPGTFTATAARDQEYDIGQPIWQAWQDIVTSLGGVDIQRNYLHVDGSPALMQMNLVPVLGSYLDNVPFHYRVGQNNLQDLEEKITTDVNQPPHNFVYVQGQGDQHGSPAAADFDDNSIAQFGLREKYVQASNIQSAAALIAIASATLLAEKGLPVVLQPTLSPTKPPYYGQFSVGDGIHIAGRRGGLVVDRDQRIFQAVITPSDDTGLETTALTVADDVDHLVVP